MQQITKRLMNWASILDEQTLKQAKIASELPIIFPHLALMPDAHLGKGATVGSVIPTVGAIIPAAVGVDIGCGMYTVSLGDIDIDFEQVAPCGVTHNSHNALYQRRLGQRVDRCAVVQKRTRHLRMAECHAAKLSLDIGGE